MGCEAWYFDISLFISKQLVSSSVSQTALTKPWLWLIGPPESHLDRYRAITFQVNSYVIRNSGQTSTCIHAQGLQIEIVGAH
jgi:hypothetical protein